jgi:hypothetical protein
MPVLSILIQNTTMFNSSQSFVDTVVPFIHTYMNGVFNSSQSFVDTVTPIIRTGLDTLATSSQSLVDMVTPFIRTGLDTLATSSQYLVDTMTTTNQTLFMNDVSWNMFFLCTSVSVLFFYTVMVVVRCCEAVLSCCAKTEPETHVIVKRKRRTIADMPQLFTDGQRIRHTITKTWIGTYDAYYNGIVYNDVLYSSLGHFASQHYKHDGEPYMRRDGWNECECESENSQWVSTSEYDAPITESYN